MKKQNAALTLFNTLRSNYGDNTYHGTNLEHVVAKTSGRRYGDELIKENVHHLKDPYCRERVAAKDPIAFTLCGGFHTRSMAELPKFYESEELGAPEIMDDVRLFLQSVDYKYIKIAAGTLASIHGWSVVYVWVENGELKSFIFSERQCRPEMMIRDENDDVIGWNVTLRPRLPLDRNRLTIKPVQRTLFKGQPGVIPCYRTSEGTTYGYGLSKLENTWDIVTKIREESHANSLRSRVFPMATVPHNWQDKQIDEYMKALSHMDESSALVTRSGVDAEGNSIPELPQYQWLSAASGASQKSANGSASGGGGMAALSSEWTRLCATTFHTLRYYTGNPGGALSAADVDSAQDIEADIEEFKLFDGFLENFLEWAIQFAGIPLQVPEGFVAKSHWQWKRDEQALMEQQMAMFDMQMQSDANDNKQDSQKQNHAIGQILYNCMRNNFDMQMRPVASSSVKGIGLKDQKLLVQYHGKTGGTYQYDFKSAQEGLNKYYEMLNSPSKGGFVNDELKGTQMGPAWGSGKMTRGGTTASKVPYERSFRSPMSIEGGYQEYGKEAGKLQEGKMDWMKDQGMDPTARAPKKLGLHDMFGSDDGKGEIQGLTPPGEGTPAQAQAQQQPQQEFQGESTQGGYEFDGFADQSYGGVGAELAQYDSSQTDTMAASMKQSPQAAAPQQAQAQGQPQQAQQPQAQQQQSPADFMLGRMKQGRYRTYEEMGKFMSGYKPKERQSIRQDLISSGKLGGRATAGLRMDYMKKQWHGAKDPLQKEQLMMKHKDLSDEFASYQQKPPKGASGGIGGMASMLKKLMKNEAPTDLSYKKFNEFCELEIGHTFGKQTYENIKKLNKSWQTRTRQKVRRNSVAFGNGMDFQQPLFYKTENGFSEEYACKRDWKKLIGKSGPLTMLHRGNDYTVGTYTVESWDDEKDLPVDKIDYDPEKVRKICNDLKLNGSRIIKKLDAGNVPDLSTEYYCDVVWDKKQNRFMQTNFRNIGASFVEFGNCPDNVCQFEHES